MGEQNTRSHAATGASRDAQHFVASWHTGHVSQTAWEIARMAHRQDQNTRATFSRGTQTQTSAQNAPQTGLSASKSSSYVVHSEFSEEVG
jgi:hypothetical protein